MKKFLALILVSVMLFAVVSCGGTNDAKDTDTTLDTTLDTTVDTAEGTDTEATTDTESAEGGEVAGETWGQTLLGVFNDAIAANPAATAEELANAVITHESILFMGGSMPMEAGAEWMPGFTAAPTGWKECVNFGPMMGSIAFVGYVFTLEDGADVDAFKATLSETADPRWQICVTADETIVENVGNTVFFLMCPFSNNPDVPTEGGDL